MKYRTVKFPGSDVWRIQLSERPCFRTDVVHGTFRGEDAICLLAAYETRDEAEKAITGMIAGGEAEVGEWRGD